MGVWWGRVLSLMLLTVAGILLLGAPAVHADPAVTFADDQPLVIDLTSCPCSPDVLVVNSATQGGPVNVTLSVAGPAAKYLRVASTPTAVQRGGPKPIKVRVTTGAVASTGTLILTAGDGSLDREPVHLVGALPPAPGASFSTLRPGTFDALTVHAISFVPSFFRPLPSALKWAGAGLIAFIVSAVLLDARTRHDTSSAWLITAITVGSIAAGLTALVLFSGSVASGISYFRHGVAVDPQSWTLAPPAPGRIDADLIGDNGQIGLMVADGSTLTIKDLPSAGTYTGTIDTQPADDAGTIKATVTVRDWWLYAFAAVLIGVLVGWAISLFYVRRPGRQLQADAAASAAVIAHHESDWCERSAGQAWSEPYAFAGFAQGALARILSSATSNPDGAAADLAALTVLDTAMEGLRSAVASLGDQRTALRVKYSGVVDDSVLASPGWLRPLEPVLDLTGQPLSQAQTVINDRRGLISGVAAVAETVSQCSDRLDDLVPDIAGLSGETWDSLHGQWVSLLQDVLSAADGNALQPLTSRIDTLKQDVQNALRSRDVTAVPQSGSRQDAEARRAFGQLAVRLRAGPPVVPGPAAVAAPVVVLGISATANMDTLLAVTVRATGLAENTNVHWEFSDGVRSAVFPAPPPGPGGTTELSTRHSFVSGPEQAFANVVDDDGRPVSLEPWRGAAGSFSFAQRLRATLGADDRVVAIVAGVLAVGSGMAALYLNVPAWGSAGDYIAALLWGSVTSEGVKLVVNAVGKRWPLAS